ncbi:hypothetical protein [Arthrobacter sp. A5]|uniref:hypothetical protein n=1 Tax=Arthrobacter sp. A5 TaxID=576926 RepID=UPI003DA880EB
MNFMSVISEEATGDYAQKYDAAFVFANVKGFAQEAAIRIKWSTPMAAEILWYVTEVPTVFVSLNQSSHLIDVPMVGSLLRAPRLTGWPLLAPPGDDTRRNMRAG